MNFHVKKVASKHEAIEAIESGEYKIVDLDYKTGNADVLGLARFARKHIVAVQHLSQVTVTVKNEIALQEKLTKPKSTYKQRFIHLEFDIEPEALARYQAMASEHCDMVIPMGHELSHTEVWE